MTIALWYIYNNKYIMSLLYIVILFGTKTRLAIAIFIIGIVIMIFDKVINIFGTKLNKMFISVLILMIPILVMTNYANIETYLDEDIDNTIRFYSIKKSIEILEDYPILGTSIGTFNGNGSLRYNKTIYNKYNFDNNFLNIAMESSSGFESQLARQLIETGILGTLLYYSIFINTIIFLVNKNKTKYNKCFIFIIIVNIINSFLNPMYSLPLVIFSLIAISYNDTKYEEIRQQRYKSLNLY